MPNFTPTGLPWIDKAMSYLGLTETHGPKTTPKIADWLAKLKLGWRDDETAWCGTFVGGVLNECGMAVVANPAGARNWERYGNKLDRPAVGAIVTFWRDSPSSGKGHVGFVVGKDQHGNLMVLGGNQGDAVCIKPFATARITSYRWPSIAPAESRFDLPVISSDGKLSTNEA
jgi:uncharacterized protein (TIGR02594 family)